MRSNLARAVLVIMAVTAAAGVLRLWGLGEPGRKVFDEVYLLTGGGPGTATEVLSFTIYRRFFTEDRVGYGSAMSIVALVVLALAIILAMGASRRQGARA